MEREGGSFYLEFNVEFWESLKKRGVQIFLGLSMALDLLIE